jgi:hypothetical protein
MTKGTYGLIQGDGSVEAKTKKSAPFSLSKNRESQLVASGVAVYVCDQTHEIKINYADLKLSDLRKIAGEHGVNGESIRTKKELIALIEAYKEGQDAKF